MNMYGLDLIFIQLLIILCTMGYNKFFYIKHLYILITFLIFNIFSLFFCSKLIFGLILFVIYYIFVFIFSYIRLRSILLVSFFYLLQNSLLTIIWILPNFFSDSIKNKLPFLYLTQIPLLLILLYILNIIEKRHKLWTLLQDYHTQWANLGLFLFFTSNLMLIYRQFTISVEGSINSYIYSSFILIGYSIFLGIITFLIIKISINKTYIDKLIDKSKENSQFLTMADEFQHDFKTFLYTTKRYTELEDLPGLTKYLESLDSYSFPILSHPLRNQVQHINSPAIQGLLIQCIEKCHSNNINLMLEIEDFSHQSFFYSIDFTRCLSILITNAIEHSSKSLYIRFSNNNGVSSCIVRNTSKTPVKINEIFKRNFSTKVNHKGIGLSILKNIIKNYKHTDLFVENINNWVSFTIISTK